MYRAFLILAFSIIPIAAFCSENPSFIESKVWVDSEIEYHIDISIITDGEFFSPNWKSTIHAKKCQVLNSKECLDIWEINDFNSTPYQFVKYEPNSLKIEDFNNDGILDSVFLYRIASDGNDPHQIKAMFHILDKKYAIRGNLPLLTDYASGYSYKFDDAFNSLDRSTIIKCKEIWDEYINQVIFEADMF